MAGTPIEINLNTVYSCIEIVFNKGGFHVGIVAIGPSSKIFLDLRAKCASRNFAFVIVVKLGSALSDDSPGVAYL